MSVFGSIGGGFFKTSRFYPVKIPYSVRFNDDDTAYMTKTFAGEGDGIPWTYSVWLKRCNIGSFQYIFGAGDAADANERTYFYFENATDKLYFKSIVAGVSKGQLTTDMVFRDTTNWYHLFVAYDGANAVAADRMKIWVNGVLVDLTIATPLNQHENTYISKSSEPHWIGKAIPAGALQYDGYMAELNFIDALESVNNFGQTKNGVWIHKRYTGAYGTNGFYFTFENSSHFGEDQSGNGNDFTDSGLAANDQVIDTPTNNYPTLNVLNKNINLGLAEGNLLLGNGGAAWYEVLATQALPPTGKWYWEVDIGADTAFFAGGVRSIEVNDQQIITAVSYTGDDTDSWAAVTDGEAVWDKYTNAAGTAMDQSLAANDILQIAVDVDTGKIWFGVNGTWCDSGDPVAGTNEAYSGLPNTLSPASAGHTNSTSIINFGQLGFVHTPPAGFKALCTKNLPEPSIKKPNLAFDILLHTGDDVDGRDISGLLFQPDLMWIKNRTQARSHVLFDSVRGVGSNKGLLSDSTATEITANTAGYGYIDVINSDGFRLRNGSTDQWYTNEGGENFVDWCWKIGPQYGFDIVADQGTGSAHAINHNCGGPPELIIRKGRDTSVPQSWLVYHHHALNKTDPETDYGILDLTNAWTDELTAWNDIAPTSTQFTVGTSTTMNENGKNFITYLWRSIPGFSKVFSFEGNANADGPVVNCEFRSRFVLFKNADGAHPWWIFDTARSTYNVAKLSLQPDSGGAEQDNALYQIDILSNGFKIRTANVNINTNNNTYVGIAMAELPGKYSNAR